MNTTKINDAANAVINGIIKLVTFAQPKGIINGLWTDGPMILTKDEKIFNTLTNAFDLLALSFTTGAPDNEEESYYINFEYSDGIDL